MGECRNKKKNNNKKYEDSTPFAIRGKFGRLDELNEYSTAHTHMRVYMHVWRAHWTFKIISRTETAHLLIEYFFFFFFDTLTSSCGQMYDCTNDHNSKPCVWMAKYSRMNDVVILSKTNNLYLRVNCVIMHEAYILVYGLKMSDARLTLSSQPIMVVLYQLFVFTNERISQRCIVVCVPLNLRTSSKILID